MNLSIIIPFCNEEKSIRPLYKKTINLLNNNKNLIDNYELIFVNDGSTDNSNNEVLKIKDKNIKLISLEKNCGKSEALATGFKASKYDILVTIDCDLQDDPEDIPKLLHKINEGYYCVSGWRHQRSDSFTKVISSKIANYVKEKILKESINDSVSPLKAIRKEAVKNMFLFNGFHRFIPFLVKIQGFKICEVEVNHRKRIYGKSKYNIWNRLFKALGDLYVMNWLKKNRIK